MMYNRGRHLSRRALIRGAGGLALSLPFLDAMVPAVAHAQAAAPPKRLSFVYFPNGFIREKWNPTAEGRNFELPSSLEPLAPFKDKLTVLTGLACDPAKTTAGFHDRAIASFMTGVELVRGEERTGISVDQIAAPVLGKDVPFGSLELAVQEVGNFGGPSFKSGTNRLPFETNPRYAFERLFGDADRLDPVVLAELRDNQRSILDAVSGDMSTLMAKLGSSDREKVKEYLDSVRDIERRLSVMDRLSAKEVVLERPAGTPDNYADHLKMMMDLKLVALQTDMTRVCTFMMGMEASDMTFQELAWDNSHHLTSHHGNNPEQIAGCAKINRYQVELFTYFLEKADAIQEAEGSLLDNTLLMYGSSLGDANRHIQVDIPVLVFGGRSMGVKGGQHLVYPQNTPITNLYLTMLDKVGVPVDKMGDSTGQLRGLTDV
jgi:hypothetical protein